MDLGINGGGLTLIWLQAAVVLNVQIRKCPMDVSAYFLAGLSRSKNSNHRDLGRLLDLRRTNVVAQLRVITRRGSLIVVDAI